MSINEHFRREGKFNLWIVVLPILIGIVAAIVIPNVLDLLDRRAEARCHEAKGTYEREQHSCIAEPAKPGGG